MPRRYRHLMSDLIALIPHCKKDSKLDTKSDRNVLNEVADMKVRTGTASTAHRPAGRAGKHEYDSKPPVCQQICPAQTLSLPVC